MFKLVALLPSSLIASGLRTRFCGSLGISGSDALVVIEAHNMEPESQNLVDAVIAALRDARKRGKEGKVRIALSFLAPNGQETITWSAMVLTILDGEEATASILHDILENLPVRSLDSALRVFRRTED
jgi:hypothetical protein